MTLGSCMRIVFSFCCYRIEYLQQIAKSLASPVAVRNQCPSKLSPSWGGGGLKKDIAHSEPLPGSMTLMFKLSLDSRKLNTNFKEILAKSQFLMMPTPNPKSFVPFKSVIKNCYYIF